MFQQLLSHTHELHSDYEPLKQAIAAIESVSRVINEQRRASDILQRVDCEVCSCLCIEWVRFVSCAPVDLTG